MKKTFVKAAAGFFLPAILAFIASGFTDFMLTAVIFVAGYLVSAFIFRANILMFIGSRLYASNKNLALKFYKAAYKTGKLNPGYQLFYSYILIRCASLDEAETVMNKAVVLGKHTLKESEFKECDFNRAIIVWKRGDISSAIVKLEELYDEGYRTTPFLGSLSSLYLLNKEFDKALEIAKEGIEYRESDMVSHDNLGQAYIELGMLDEAQQVYDALIPKCPKFLEAYYNYASLLEKRGELEEAKKHYGVALTIEENFLSTVSHCAVNEAYERVSALII